MSTTTCTVHATGETFTLDEFGIAGTVVRECGYGVTVAKRDPPARPGAEWVAPYAANCGEHGWIASRATVDQASEEARAHMAGEHPTAADRAFTPARKAQGFK